MSVYCLKIHAHTLYFIAFSLDQVVHSLFGLLYVDLLTFLYNNDTETSDYAITL